MTCASTPEIIEQPNNRVDLIFTVTEGGKTGVKSIEFVGNVAYSSYRLKDIIKTRESNLLSFLGGADVYDPDRVEADRDLIRRFYLKNGYADVQVVAALTEYDPDKKGFSSPSRSRRASNIASASVDFQTSHRNARYRTRCAASRASASARSTMPKRLRNPSRKCRSRPRGAATPSPIVRPRGDRNFEAHTVSIVFAVDEGPRTYIERINVRGNTRTRDYVIRREFDLSEGDAYNRALVDRAERRLKNLDFFKSVKIADRARLVDRSRDSGRRSRREIDRRLLGVGRLFDHRRCARRSQHFRAQLPRPRPVCEGGRDLRPVRARWFAVVRRALSARLSRRARPRPVLSRATWPTAISPTAPRRLASARGSASPCGKISRCSCATRSISRKSQLPSQLANCNNNSVELVARVQSEPGICESGRRSAGGSITSAANRHRHLRHRPVVLQRWRSLAAGPQGTAERQDADLVGRLFAELQHAGQQQEPDRRLAGRLRSRTSPASAAT